MIDLSMYERKIDEILDRTLSSVESNRSLDVGIEGEHQSNDLSSIENKILLESEINSMKRVLSVIEELSELREKVLVGVTLLDEVVDSINLGDNTLNSSI
jgi:hypothetical protein